MRKFIYFFLIVHPIFLLAQDREQYIEKFASIAVSEMHRTGIPASIKLAQGILESNAGSSTLAIQANNHFGIKCGSEWLGKKMYRKDDDRDKRGRLVKSCFRSFRSAESSYIAHSEFLADPKKDYRYGKLFHLASDDYVGWAHGLKKAGYATNPRYPQLLIKIIEDYDLFKYDKHLPIHSDTEIIAATKEKQTNTTPTVNLSKRIYTVKYENKVKYVLALGGDTPRKIADEMHLPSSRLIQSNETLKRKYQPLKEGQRIYLQPKKSSFQGRQKFHVVKPGETMIHISDHYAVKLKKLRKRNGLETNEEPAIGQKIYLRGKNPKSVKTTDNREDNVESQLTFLWKDEERKEAIEESSQDSLDQSMFEIVSSEPQVPSFIQYTVQPKDTLYGIARLHGTSVEILKNLNNLGTATIHPGQVLKIQ